MIYLRYLLSAFEMGIDAAMDKALKGDKLPIGPIRRKMRISRKMSEWRETPFRYKNQKPCRKRVQIKERGLLHCKLKTTCYCH